MIVDYIFCFVLYMVATASVALGTVLCFAAMIKCVENSRRCRLEGRRKQKHVFWVSCFVTNISFVK